MRKIESLIFHWSVTYPETTVKDVRKMHLQRGYRDIGYHRYILHPNSHELKKPAKFWWQLVKEGRYINEDIWLEEQEIGAHTLYQNRKSVGICVNGHPSYPLHPLQKVAIRETAQIMAKRYGLDVRKDIYGHRDFNATQCPGDEIYKVITDIKNGTYAVCT